MKVIETSIVIQASANRVWRLLTDLDNYENWNPFIVFASGELATGKQLQIRSTNDVIGVPYYGRVTAIVANDYTLSWTFSWITSQVKKTVCSFTIETINSESVRFIQIQSLSGLTSIFLRRRGLHSIESYMVSMNKALKRLAENKKHLLPKSWTTAA